MSKAHKRAGELRDAVFAEFPNVKFPKAINHYTERRKNNSRRVKFVHLLDTVANRKRLKMLLDKDFPDARILDLATMCHYRTIVLAVLVPA